MKITLETISFSKILAVVMAIVALVAVGYAHNKPPEVVSVPEYKLMAEPVEVVKIERVEVEVERVIVIEKVKLVKIMPDLPQEVISNPAKEITAVREVDCPEGGATVRAVAVLDTDTGETEMVAKVTPTPRKFLGFPNARELGIRYGLGGTGQVGVIYGRWGLVRMGSVHLGLYAEGDTTGQARLMIEAGWRF